MPKGNWRKSTICDPRPLWCSLLNENQIEFDVFAHLKNWMCAARSRFPLFFEASQSSPVSQVGGGASDTPLRRFAESGQRRRCFQPRPSGFHWDELCGCFFFFWWAMVKISQTGFHSGRWVNPHGGFTHAARSTRSNLLSKLVRGCSKEILIVTSKALTRLRTQPRGKCWNFVVLFFSNEQMRFSARQQRQNYNDECQIRYKKCTSCRSICEKRGHHTQYDTETDECLTLRDNMRNVIQAFSLHSSAVVWIFWLECSSCGRFTVATASPLTCEKCCDRASPRWVAEVGRRGGRWKKNILTYLSLKEGNSQVFFPF